MSVAGMPEPPEGYAWRRSRGLLLCCRPEAMAMMLRALGAGEEPGGAPGGEGTPPPSDDVLPGPVARLLDPGLDGATPGATGPGREGGAGRGAVARIPLEDGSTAVLKRYRRGGLAGRVLPSVYADRERPLREIRIAEAVRRAGAPVAEPLAAVFAEGRLLRAVFLVTRELPGRVPLSEALRGASPREAGALLEEAAGAARLCHDAGLVHGDLNLGNILAARPVGDGPRTGPRQGAVIIDLDRATFRPGGASPRERFDNLSRLGRSHEKLFGATGPWGSDPVRRLVEAYAAGFASLRSGMIALLPRHERAMRLHRLGWKLFGGAASR